MKFKLLPLSAAILLSFHSQLGLAQGTAKDAASTKNANETEEVIVTGKYSVSQTKALDTATGLGLTIAETPQSVSVLTFERMQDQNITSVLEAVNNAVGVTSEEVDNVRNSFYSRGFQIDSYQIDGVPTSWSLGGDASETVADTVIYERIEIVRGATGLMTAVGDPSASINLVRKHANSKELTGFVDVGVGSWEKKTFAADVATGLNESGSVRGRLVGRYQGGESFVDSLEDDKSTLYGVIEADLTDSTLLRAGASYQHNDPKGATWGVLPAFFSDGTRPDWDVSKTTAMDWTRWESTNTNYFASLNHAFANGWELLANYNHMSYETDSRLLYVATPWNATTRSYTYLDKATGAGLTAQRYRADSKSEQDSFDIQLKGDFNLFSQTHDFVAGALYSDQSAKTFTQLPQGADLSSGYDQIPVDNFYEWSDVPEPAWETKRTQSQDSNTEQSGVYAATRLSATDNLKFILGGRLATWERTGFDWSGVVDYGDKNEFIPYAGALYDLTDAHRIYASYTEILKPQNNRDASGDFLDPLVGESMEIGLKSRFLDDRLQTTLAFFDIQQDNLAQLDTGFVGTPDQRTAYIGAEGANSKGFEIEVVGQPVDGWNISAGYTQFSIEDAKGNDLNTDNPTESLKLFTSYEFGGVLENLMLGGGVNWQNETYSEGINPIGQADRLTQDAYALVNLMARYTFTDNLSAQFNAANVTDEKYYSQVGYFSTYRYGTPRNYTLSLNYKF